MPSPFLFAILLTYVAAGAAFFCIKPLKFFAFRRLIGGGRGPWPSPTVTELYGYAGRHAAADV